MPGTPHISPFLRIKISGLDAFTLNGTSMGFPANATLLQNAGGSNSGWGLHEVYQGLLLPMCVTSGNGMKHAGADG